MSTTFYPCPACGNGIDMSNYVESRPVPDQGSLVIEDTRFCPTCHREIYLLYRLEKAEAVKEP